MSDRRKKDLPYWQVTTNRRSGADRRRHHGIFRIFFIPLGQLLRPYRRIALP